MRSTVKGENLLIGEQILPLTVDPHCEGGQSSKVASSKSLHLYIAIRGTVDSRYLAYQIRISACFTCAYKSYLTHVISPGAG